MNCFSVKTKIASVDEGKLFFTEKFYIVNFEWIMIELYSHSLTTKL
jgi:hypothetical protein